MRPFQLFRRVTVALATLAVLVVGWQVGTQRTRSAPERAGHWTRLALAGPLAAPPLFDEIVVFGHSHCDNGNDFILTQGLVVPQPYWGGRFSNGPLWVERLAERLHLGHSTERNPLPAPREAGGTNYAFGGATTGSGYFACVVLADGTEVCLPNVGLQIEMFFADGRTLDGDELIVLHAGDNDASPEIAARNMGEHIAGLAAAGGKWFLVRMALPELQPLC